MAPSDAGPTELCSPDPGASRQEVLGRRVRCLTGSLGSTPEGPLLGKMSSPRGPGCPSACAHGSERNRRWIRFYRGTREGGHLYTPRTHRVPSSCPHRHTHQQGLSARCTQPAALLSSGRQAERPLLCALENPGSPPQVSVWDQGGGWPGPGRCGIPAGLAHSQASSGHQGLLSWPGPQGGTRGPWREGAAAGPSL